MRRLALAAATLASCAAPAEAPPAPTTTTAAPTTTSVAPTTLPPTTTHTHAPRATRRRAASVAPVAAETAVVASGRDDAFWLRLSQCECASGRCGGPHVGFFQFSRDTAAKLGIDGSESYEEQRAAAQEWARRIHPREGTSAGWPVCWWRAAA